MNSPVRVLQMLRVMDRAGIETWLMHLLRRFDRQEIAMDFLLQSANPGAYGEEIRDLGAAIHTGCPTRNLPLYTRKFRDAINGHGPYDVVHSHNYFAAGFDVRLAAIAGVKTRIAHIHPVTDLAAARPLRRHYCNTMAEWIGRYATVMLAPSQPSLDAFAAFGESAVPKAVVRNCVDLDQYRPVFDRAAARKKLGIPPEIPVVAYVARFVPHKNHRFLLRVADRLRADGLSVHFAVSGASGETLPAFRQACAGRYDFSILPDLPEVVSLLRCSDVFLFPSLEEGFGTVAIEAAAAGLPVVATDLPAVAEACPPSHRNFVFAPQDDSAAATHVRTILEDPRLGWSLSFDARQWSEKFAVGAVVDQMADIYRTGGISRRRGRWG